ncbi:hypothetical protein RhiirA4_424599 [Rhizophagus irregularis]|uniref:ATPase domain-containing protein n=1 Tax=Rhizophagus irregularis TaxID=588596 RepID=A0A2I1GY48_9GLOM|nr:hypothetical protein RhiirA4_424599 [Rhizophagus irregularis]
MFAFKRLNIPRTYNFSFGHNYVNYMQKVNLSQFSRKKFDLFNRKQEFDLLTTKFSSNTPEIHVILGPTDSGKTTLVRQVVQNGNFNPLFIDLRISSSILLCDIRSEFQNFFESIFIKPKTKLETVNELDYELLEKISSSLPNLSYWKNHNIPPPILVIDEANKLFDLPDLSKEYKTLFKAFLSWLKLIIQNNQFHVVLTSSEPFFLDWMEYSMKALVEAEDQGFILEDDLIKEIGYKAVRSLVDYRYLYRRPNFGLNSDLTNPPAESKVMLTPMNQLSLNAAKDLLKKNNY